MTWTFKPKGKIPSIRSCILIEGLPGIGNIGKVAVDFLIDKLQAKRIYSISSYTLPHSVFVNEDNLIEMPTIELFYKKGTKTRPDIIFLTGDVQPTDEYSCYEFCEKLLDICKRLKVKEIITIGGIGQQEVPKSPKVYCTGNQKAIVARYCKGTSLSNDIYGVVGPIVGVSGLLLGLSKPRKIPAVSLLAETLGHPLYLGMKGAREVLKALNKKLALKIDIKELDKEIKSLESEMLQKTKELNQVSKETALKKI